MISAHSDRWMFVYIMTMPRGLKKIGVSAHPEFRLRQLQIANPNFIELALTRRVPRSTARWIERRAHKLLASKRVRGEWFKASLAESFWAVKTAMQESDAIALSRSASMRPVIAARAREKRGFAVE